MGQLERTQEFGKYEKEYEKNLNSIKELKIRIL
jgi:hypothetical protein